MNYCTNCGNKIDDDDVFCIKCGVKLKDEVCNYDKGGFGWGLLGFFVPIAGLILFLMWKNDKPKTAKAAGIGSLIFLIFYIVLIIFFIVFISSFRANDRSWYDDYYYYDNYYKFE